MKKLHKLTLIFRTRAFRQAFIRHGVAAGVEHDSLFASLKAELKTIVDIGANRGQFALAARHYAPGARILSFEPLQEPAAVFRNVFRRDPLVELHQVAIGPQHGSQLMHVSIADDSSSLLPISDLQTRYYPGTGERETRTVEVMPLEAVLQPGVIGHGALLKIDVQGYELEALKGCCSLLDSFDYVYVECSYVALYTSQALVGEVTEYLNQAGFSMTNVYNFARDRAGNPIQGDFLFRRK